MSGCVYRRADRGNEWWINWYPKLPDRSRLPRIRVRSPVQTKQGAELFLTQTQQEVLNGTYKTRAEVEAEKARSLTYRQFSQMSLDHTAANSPEKEECSRYRSKAAIYKLLLEAEIGPRLTLGDRLLTEITSQDIEAAKGWLRKPRCRCVPSAHPGMECPRPHTRKVSTVNTDLALIKADLWLAAEIYQLLTFEQAERVIIRFIKDQAAEPRFLTFGELAKLLLAVGHWRPLVLLMADTGLRLGEVRALAWSAVHLDVEQPYIRVRRSVSRNREGATKSRRERTIPLTRRLIEALRRLPRISSYVFAPSEGPQSGRPDARYTEGGLRRILEVCAKWADLTSKLRGGHDLRRTFATHLYLKGAPLPAIQRLLGHARIETTMRYLGITGEDIFAAIQVLELPDPVVQVAA